MLKKKSSGGGLVTALVITCIDFRLIDEAVTYFDGSNGSNVNLKNKYDEMIVAGASLGYNTSCNNVKLPSGYNQLKSFLNPTLWTKCVDDHISISSALHSITKIIVMDHLGCGAYNGQYGGTKTNPLLIYDELKYHVDQLNTFRAAINTKYQKTNNYNAPEIPFKVVPLLMSLNGSVDENPTHWDVNNNSFNLAINDVVKINGTGGLPIPTTTMVTTPLSYELLNSDMTAITSSTVFAKIYQDDSGIWSIQNLMSAQDFYKNTKNTVMSYTGIMSYRVRVAEMKAYINLTMTAYNAFYIRTGDSDWKTSIGNNDTSNTNILYWNPDSQWYDTTDAPSNQIALQFRFFAAYVTKYFKITSGSSGSANVFAGNGNVGTYSFTYNGGSSYTGKFSADSVGAKTWDYTLPVTVTTRDTVQFTFSQGTYTAQSGWS